MVDPSPDRPLAAVRAVTVEGGPWSTLPLTAPCRGQGGHGRGLSLGV